MTTRTDFLLARIAGDEKWAELFGCDDAHANTDPGPRCRDRILAECAAKRWLVGLAAKSDVMPTSHDYQFPKAQGAREALEAAVDALLHPYADHPDFLDEWKNPPPRLRP